MQHAGAQMKSSIGWPASVKLTQVQPQNHVSEGREAPAAWHSTCIPGHMAALELRDTSNAGVLPLLSELC